MDTDGVGTIQAELKTKMSKIVSALPALLKDQLELRAHAHLRNTSDGFHMFHGAFGWGSDGTEVTYGGNAITQHNTFDQQGHAMSKYDLTNGVGTKEGQSLGHTDFNEMSSITILSDVLLLPTGLYLVDPKDSSRTLTFEKGWEIATDEERKVLVQWTPVLSKRTNT